MSDTAASQSLRAPALAGLEQPRGLEAAAHLVAAFLVGAVATYLVTLTSPDFAFGLPLGFDIAYVLPELVVLLALTLAAFPHLRRYAWLLSAGGLVGYAVLYGAGAHLDGQMLITMLAVVVGLVLGGLLLAFAQAGGQARWALAFGVGAGITGGRDLLSLVGEQLGRGLTDPYVDVVLFGVLGAIVAAAGVLLLRGHCASGPVTRGPAALGYAVAVTVASLLAIAGSYGWGLRLERITRPYVGGISEQDTLRLETLDQTVRAVAAVAVLVVLVVASRWRGHRGAARWVVVGFAAALVVAGVRYLFPYAATWTAVTVGPLGAVIGLWLVRRLDRILPWEAVGLVLATGLVLFEPATVGAAVGWFGFGLFVSVGALRFAVAHGRPGDTDGSGGAGGSDGVDLLAPAVGLGITTWVLCYQVIVPSANIARPDGGLPFLPTGLLLAAAASVLLFLLDRRRVSQDPTLR